MIKALVVFYSRTGVTKKVANTITALLRCDVEEIIDKDKRKGLFGYLRSGRDGMKKRLANIEPMAKNPVDYDVVIIGTPVWANRLSSPVRSYLVTNTGKFGKVCFFCTMGGSKASKAFVEMQELCGKEPLATLSLQKNDVIEDEFASRLAVITDAVRNSRKIE